MGGGGEGRAPANAANLTPEQQLLWYVQTDPLDCSNTTLLHCYGHGYHYHELITANSIYDMSSHGCAETQLS